jgi:hypothetical protein
MVISITVGLPPVDRPDAFTSGARPGTPSPGPTTYPPVTGWLDTPASLEQFRRLSASYIASPCRRAHLHPDRRSREPPLQPSCPRSAQVRTALVVQRRPPPSPAVVRVGRSTWWSAGAQRKHLGKDGDDGRFARLSRGPRRLAGGCAARDRLVDSVDTSDRAQVPKQVVGGELAGRPPGRGHLGGYDVPRRTQPRRRTRSCSTGCCPPQ